MKVKNNLKMPYSEKYAEQKCKLNYQFLTMILSSKVINSLKKIEKISLLQKYQIRNLRVRFDIKHLFK